MFGIFKPTQVARGGRGYDLSPIMISQMEYRNILTNLKPGTPSQEQAREELDRMLMFYELNRAALYPVFAPALGHKVWEVRFPILSKWKPGPKDKDPGQALVLNFKLNQAAPGFMELPTGDGLSFTKPENENLGEGH